MRLRWTVALLAVCLAGCAGSSSASAPAAQSTPSSSATTSASPTPTPSSGPPTVTEAFTPLPCDPNTTVGMEGCVEHRILRADAIVDRRVQLIWDHSTTDGKAHLADAETAWQTYREAACLSVSDKYAGGTLAPVIAGHCALRLTVERAVELRRQLRLLTSD